MDAIKLRAWWAHRQGLDGSLAGVTPEAAVANAAVANMEAFVRDQLGDARSFSLDIPASRQPRIEALRRLAGET